MEAPAAPPLSPRLAAVAAPISAAAPAGTDATYEDAFQQLKTEVNALGEAGDVDFDRIVALSEQVLTTLSKDLNAACYLALGLVRTEGFAGMAEGLAGVRLVATGFWEDLFPPKRRMRARQNALQFLADRMADWAESARPTPDQREDVERAAQELARLQEAATERMGDQAPALGLLRRHLREALQRLPKPDPAPAAEAPPSAPTAPADGATPASPAPSPTLAKASTPAAPGGTGEIKTSADATRAVVAAARFLRESDPYDPAAVRLLRALRWGPLVAAPPAEGGTTKIPPPPEPRRAYLTGLLQKDPAALAREAEDQIGQAPFHVWLDLQRLAASALAQLGQPARAAYEAVCQEAGALAARLPDLPTLRFKDGTPFADPLTQDWLAEQAAAHAAAVGSSAGTSLGASGGDDALAEALAAAKARLADGDLAGAIGALQPGAGPPAERFRRRLAAADLLYKGGRPDVARPLLDQLTEDVDRYRLGGWDPALAAAALRLQHATLAALAAKEKGPDKAPLTAEAAAAFSRLCRVDPAAALSAG